MLTHDELRARKWILYDDVSHGYPVDATTEALIVEACGKGHRLVEYQGIRYIEGPQAFRADNLFWLLRNDSTVKEAVASGEMLIPMPADYVDARKLWDELGEWSYDGFLRRLGEEVKYNFTWDHFVSPEVAARERGEPEPEPLTREQRILAFLREVHEVSKDMSPGTLAVGYVHAGETEVAWTCRMTCGGKPYVRDIERAVGFDITAKERTTLWKQAKSGARPG